MAESFIFSIAESLITKLASLAYQEASRVVGVYDDLQELKSSLSYVKAVLLDAEQKQEQNNELREWLKQIKLIFYDAENVLDQVDCETLRKQVIRDYGTPKDKVGRFFSSSNPLVFRYKLALQIKDIRMRLDRVAADRDKFGLQVIDFDRRVVHSREMTYSHVVQSDVIGRDYDKEKIIKLLMEPSLDNNVGSKHISVIPIVGIGGLGKTTLAKLVFNDERIIDSFPLKMWVCVSEDFNIKQLIIKIINAASNFVSTGALPGHQNLKELEVEQLQYRLRNMLVGQKFILVLDDVWNEDRVKWVEMRDLISVGAKGSKVIVTTRSQSIASMMGTVTYSHHLESLSPGDSLHLFVRWAFKEGEEEKYPELIRIAREIVEKCKGVPLAVRTLGSSLFSKHERQEWESLRDKEIWNLPQKEDDIIPALKLSYDEMPSHLRQCFALLSLYPKNLEYNSFEVASLWGAAGLLPLQSQDKTMVDVAHQYLRDLMARSFLHDVFDCGTFYAFFIHDLVHDLAVYVAKDVCQLVSSNTQDISENVLHLSFVENGLPYNSIKPSLQGARSILFPVDHVGASEAFLNAWVTNCRYLRYLDLRDSTCETLPESIGKLKHLRYISLCNNKRIKRLPNSICKLQNLQVLGLDGCSNLETVPKKLRKLISLQRLEITTKQSILPESDIAKLNCLEFLCVQNCDNLESLFVETRLPTLRTLQVSDCVNLKSLPLDTHHFPQLETLLISGVANEDWLHRSEDTNAVLRLKTIVLSEMLTLPHSLQQYASTLQTLMILGCYELEVLPEWLSNLSSLKFLIMASCPKLMSLPSDIHRLTSLQVLRIINCRELYGKYEPQVGKCWPMISHIKHTDIRKPWE
ncbi:putative disease resistance protein RGA1 [Arachis hypogaea]|uniref:putative disease resistance protein RGA1 n=1 Tax=Arachis hypogaea TaxID=3818 RepID=UPI000DEC45B1|nr:putative disease resistance protein RGA1 [Arachis hypogaea]